MGLRVVLCTLISLSLALGSVIRDEADSDSLYKTVNSYLANPVAAASALGLNRVKQKEDDDTFRFKAAGVEAEFAYHKKGSPLDGGWLSLSFEESVVARLFPWLSRALRTPGCMNSTEPLMVKVTINIGNIRNGYLTVELGYELYTTHTFFGNYRCLFTISKDKDNEIKKIPTRVLTLGIKIFGPDVLKDFNGKLDLEKRKILVHFNHQEANYTLHAQASKDVYPDLSLSVLKGSTELWSIQALAQTPKPNLVIYDKTLTVHGCFEDKMQISWETEKKIKGGQYGLSEGKFNLHLLSQYDGNYIVNTTAEFTHFGIRLATAITKDGRSKLDNVLTIQYAKKIPHDTYDDWHHAFSMVTMVYDLNDESRGIFHEINGHISDIRMRRRFPYIMPYFQVAFDSSYNGHKALMFNMDTRAFPFDFDFEINDCPGVPAYCLYLPLPFSRRLKVSQKVVGDRETNGFEFHLNVDDLLFNISGIVEDENGGKGKIILKNDWSRNNYSEKHVLVVSKSENGNNLTTTFVSVRTGQRTEEYGLELYLDKTQIEQHKHFRLVVFKKDQGNIVLQTSIDAIGKQFDNLYGTKQEDYEIVYQSLYHQERGKTTMKISVEHSKKPSVRLTLNYQVDSSAPMMAILEYQRENVKQTGMYKYDFSVIRFDPSYRGSGKIEMRGSVEDMCTNPFKNVKLSLKRNNYTLYRISILDGNYEVEINDYNLLPVLYRIVGLPTRDTLKIKAIHKSDADDGEAEDNADMHLVYGPNKAELQHAGNQLLMVGYAGNSVALGIFQLSGNLSLGAMADWQLSRQGIEINIAGSVARLPVLDEPLEAKFKISHQSRNRTATFGIGITGLDNPVRLVTPKIDLDVLEYVYYEVFYELWYHLPYYFRNYLRRSIDSLFWDNYHYYHLTKMEFVKMLSEPTSPACDGTESSIERSINDMDFDNDGIINPLDNDDDNDGLFDEYDSDDDNDGIPDHEDKDDDNDGILDIYEYDLYNNRTAYNRTMDFDGDGIMDWYDEDEDDDNDGIPDDFDEDKDNDGIPDIYDVYGNRTEYMKKSLDTDGDGLFDEYDSDDDNDGIPDHEDTDDDNDGILDIYEYDSYNNRTGYNRTMDFDGDGIMDWYDSDDDNDGIPDDQDVDDDNDGIPDDIYDIKKSRDFDDDGDGGPDK